MRIRTTVVVAVVLGSLFSTLVQAEDAYVCIGEQSTGFAFYKDTKTWRNFTFKASKWIVKRSNDPQYEWEVFKVGDKFSSARCKDDFNRRGLLFCEGLVDFRMSRDNLRFISAYLYGYWSDVLDPTAEKSDFLKKSFREGANAPSVEIGTCSGQ